jgi:DNA-directed RNA polymerase specialized sigma24 family protein
MRKALTEEQAEEAMLLRAKGYSYGEIGKVFKISANTAENAVKRAGAYRYGWEIQKDNN